MFEGILQPTHLILILAIVLIIFGPGKLPELGKTLGSGIREFRDSVGNMGAGSDSAKSVATTTVTTTTPVVPAADAGTPVGATVSNGVHERA